MEESKIKEQLMNCSNCGAELPADARFCIECGSENRAAATGETVKIALDDQGPHCGNCGAQNPSGAIYCVNCGQRLIVDIGHLPAEPAELERRPPQPSMPPMPSMSPMPAAPGRKRRRKMGDDLTGGLFLIGLAILFLTGTFWPGILVLIGLSGMLSSFGHGKTRDGLSAFVFMSGLALLFATDAFWPGILILIGLLAIIQALIR